MAAIVGFMLHCDEPGCGREIAARGVLDGDGLIRAYTIMLAPGFDRQWSTSSARTLYTTGHYCEHHGHPDRRIGEAKR